MTDVLERPQTIDRHERAAPRIRDRFNVDEFMAMVQAKVFGEKAHLELHEGRIVELNTEGSRHSFNKGAAYSLMRALLRGSTELKAALDLAVRLYPDRPTVVGPDVVVIEAPVGRPGTIPATSVRLAIEHADSTLDYDLGDKPAMYAGAAVPELWVLDDQSCTLHRFHSPRDGAYARDPARDLDAEIDVPFAPGTTVKVRDLFDLD